jgi:integrase
MEIVEPIRDPKKIAALKQYLLGGKNIRNYTLVVLGLNSALRISDILKLTWEAVYDFTDDEFRTHVYLREMKTDKSKKLTLNNSATKALALLKNSIDCRPNDYIFMSREGDNRPITRIMALKIVKSASEAVGIKERIGCHSLRKTFGYHSWKKGVPLPLLCELFNHSTQQVTKRYLGIIQDDLDAVYRLIEL